MTEPTINRTSVLRWRLAMSRANRPIIASQAREDIRKLSDLIEVAGSRADRAAYVARQRAMGRRQRGYCLTDAEAEAVAQLIEQLRQSQPVAANGRTVERR